MASKHRAARFRRSVLSLRIGRQEQKPSAARFDQFFGPFAFMKADIVENNDVAR
ncbi:hypothetical protein EV129_1185 [Rhizobium azibense]|uniref:Uncharacterized protein n=1 Tax=Rhizobium azibense TaxID=1136135 RepID=A0A4R3RBJ0_9HYPH|nr:hypothetical protein EV129_1185 [Rhizobium azibense]